MPKEVDDIIVETNHGPKPSSQCRPILKWILGEPAPTIIYGAKEYTRDEWHEVRDSFGYPIKEGQFVKIVGRPFGDCKELDFQIEDSAKIGSEIRVRKLNDLGAELEDGFYYPRSSYR